MANQTELALQYYNECVDLYDADDKQQFASDMYKQALNYFIKLKRWDNAITLLEKMIEVYSSLGSSYISEAWKSHLSIVIIHLAQNDYVAADKYYQSALS
eukprot:TRINITY_DN2409_c0_g1_i6.p1 TRINITY_DN2409_c0_g1~~TRINITY_DN2409_c0_g1_i6.p1  ORF type:complete len:100 (+),score=9.57 TRINITY_DN2409_c0_g1_i6:206-505(+)